MVNIQKSGDSAIKFTFTDNDRYLYDGEITVPLNSLILVFDESDMVVIKKTDGDVFLTFLIDNTNFSSKAELEEWFKKNAFDTGGVTEEWVEEYVSESISGKADTSDVATVSGDVNTLSGSVNTLTGNVNTLSGDVSTLSGSVDSNHNAITAVVGDVQTLSGDVANKADTTAVTASINSAVSGKMDTSAFNTYSASTDARLSEDEEVTSAALNELNDALDDKADTSAVTASIAAAVSGKQDTLVSGTNIKTINNESLLGSGNIDIQGGGKAIVAGRGIAITTGATADTVSFNLPVSAGTGTNSLILGYFNNDLSGSNAKATDNGAIASGAYCSAMAKSSFAFGYRCKTQGINGNGNFAQGYGTTASGRRCHSEGLGTTASADASHSEGCNTTASGDYSHSEGEEVTATNVAEHSQGRYNVSNKANNTWGDSGNTLFSVGNGTSANARHNAFEIRQNGDIYITKDGSDVKLQDQLGGGGVPESAFTAYTAATDARLAEDEEVTAAALNTLNTATAANTTALGGLKLVSLTQAQYDALATKDASTLYFITSSN